MERINLLELEAPQHTGDIVVLVKSALDRGFEITLQEAEKLWQLYSDQFKTGWLELPKDPIVLGSIIEKEIERELDPAFEESSYLKYFS